MLTSLYSVGSWTCWAVLTPGATAGGAQHEALMAGRAAETATGAATVAAASETEPL